MNRRSLIKRPTVLFFAEAATLSHVARPWTLANALDPNEFNVIFCRNSRFDRYLTIDPNWHATAELNSERSEVFLANLLAGRPIFNYATLERYVEEDLQMIEDFRPDLVVGDLRLSLKVAAQIAQIPYFNITNAYWNSVPASNYPLADIPVRRRFGKKMGGALLRAFAPMASHLHARSLRRICTKYGVPTDPSDISQLYTEGDLSLFCDAREVIPDHKLKIHHRFLGPVLWNPKWNAPDWWNSLPTGSPSVFVTLEGWTSSGLIHTVVDALSELPLTVIVNAKDKSDIPERKNVLRADWIPTNVASSKCQLTICDGGNSDVYHAIAEDSAVLGIPRNVDQYLNMRYMQASGAARQIEFDEVTKKRIQDMTTAMFADRLLRENVIRLRKILKGYDATAEFQRLVRKQIGLQMKTAV